MDSKGAIQGRLISLEKRGETLFAMVRNQKGLHEESCEKGTDAKTGDIVAIENGKLKVLTPFQAKRALENVISRAQDQRRLKATTIRTQTEQCIRDYFRSYGFTETRTPLLVPCPGMEPHIRPFKIESWSKEAGDHSPRFLPTSPEFAMKKLLVGGLEKIFQITPAFRDEPNSSTHSPEFTMLEWYRAYADYEEIMKDTEDLICGIANRLHGKDSVTFQGKEISVATPWPRLKIRDLFLEHVQVDIATAKQTEMFAACSRFKIKTDKKASWDDLYFLLWLNVIENKLPADKAVIVCDYPPSQAALSVVAPDDNGIPRAKRFEVYAGGLELGNAFEELTDPIEQRKRFIEDMELRAKTYGKKFEPVPLDEEFLEALEQGMPPSAGIAVGVDRLIMLLADEPEIEKTFW